MLYSTFYLDARLDTQQLEAVSKNLGSLPGGSQWQFFTTSKGSLGRLTPLEALPESKRSSLKRSDDVRRSFVPRGHALL